MVRLHMFQEDRLQIIWDQTSSTRIIAVKITLLLWCCAYLTWFQKSIWLCWSQIHWRNTNCLWLWSRLQIFKTLYRNITARILIKGFASESIKIERGVKQGDALSCAIFIICIDPLLRNLNNNRRIKEVKLLRKTATNEEINYKGAAYADDISVICKKAMTAYSKFSTYTKD